MKYNFANLTFEVELSNMRCGKVFNEYIDNGQTDVFLKITENDILYEESVVDGTFSKKDLVFSVILRKLGELLPNHNAFVLHSATFDVGGVGIAFAAQSGTGKSTHMMLWQELLGERMKIVNGDKPIVRFFEDEPNTPYAYGTPWNGKERLGCNMRTPLKHICFIERAEENSVEELGPKDAIDRIFNQVYMPKDPIAAMKTIELINRLISCCNLWKIKCNMDISAAETAYEKIFNI